MVMVYSTGNVPINTGYVQSQPNVIHIDGSRRGRACSRTTTTTTVVTNNNGQVQSYSTGYQQPSLLESLGFGNSKKIVTTTYGPSGNVVYSSTQVSSNRRGPQVIIRNSPQVPLVNYATPNVVSHQQPQIIYNGGAPAQNIKSTFQDQQNQLLLQQQQQQIVSQQAELNQLKATLQQQQHRPQYRPQQQQHYQKPKNFAENSIFSETLVFSLIKKQICTKKKSKFVSGSTEILSWKPNK